MKCDLLTNPSVIDRVRSLSFKITIKAEDLEVASNPALWPYRVVVRKFVNFRKKIEDEFAPNPCGFAGVQPLGHPQISQHYLNLYQQVPSFPQTVELYQLQTDSMFLVSRMELVIKTFVIKIFPYTSLFSLI